mmetsp:Transcript_16817/g.36511  ORF Transcript_16817/g.36511 Transcript_16817/m.36511 type:complete len:215 (+) Transcript_16817:142-786(+)
MALRRVGHDLNTRPVGNDVLTRSKILPRISLIASANSACTVSPLSDFDLRRSDDLDVASTMLFTYVTGSDSSATHPNARIASPSVTTWLSSRSLVPTPSFISDTSSISSMSGSTMADSASPSAGFGVAFAVAITSNILSTHDANASTAGTNLNPSFVPVRLSSAKSSPNPAAFSTTIPPTTSLSLTHTATTLSSCKHFSIPPPSPQRAPPSVLS